MPRKDAYLMSQRNAAIRDTFYRHLQSGVPIMTAYTLTAEQHFLSIEWVRKIIAAYSH